MEATHPTPTPDAAPGRSPTAPDLGAAFERLLRHAEAEGRRLDLRTWLSLAESWRIEQALRQTRGNRSAAARLLGIGRRTLYAKMEKLGL
jgi:DNA-binding NtrC family response regulator